MTITFKEHNTKYVCEVFGVANETFTMVCESMDSYFKRLKEADNKNYDTKTIMLAEYLDSPEFRDINFPLDTPNAVFLLGYIFAKVLERRRGDGFSEFLANMIGEHKHSHTDDDGGELPN